MILGLDCEGVDIFVDGKGEVEREICDGTPLCFKIRWCQAICGDVVCRALPGTHPNVVVVVALEGNRRREGELPAEWG